MAYAWTAGMTAEAAFRCYEATIVAFEVEAEDLRTRLFAAEDMVAVLEREIIALTGEPRTGSETDDNDAATQLSVSGDEVPLIRGDNRPAKKMMEAFIRSRPLPDVVVIDSLYKRDGESP